MERNPGWCWVDPVSDEDYYEVVTTRHVLSQASGIGTAKPGSAFTYDSDIYISHLSYLVGKLANGSALGWVTENYAVPLGLPNLFAYKGFDIILDLTPRVFSSPKPPHTHVAPYCTW